jgi:predicted lipoprotein
MRACCLAIAAALIPCAIPAQAENATIAAAVSRFVRPAYAALHRSAATLRAGTEELCALPSPERLEAVRSGFSGIVAAWSHVEIVRIGPVAEENRLERMLFWPDRRGIGLRQVQAALAKGDTTAADPGTLSGKSVAMQGLGAFEFVAFGTGSETLAGAGDSFRCAYGLAIARNVETIAAGLDDAWQKPDGFALLWANPGDGNPLYRTDAEAMNELLGIFVHGLEMIRDVRIDGFLGATRDEDRPKQGIYWRSGNTIPSISANLGGMRSLFEAADFARLLDEPSKYIPGSIAFEFRNVENALGDADAPIERSLADPRTRTRLGYARLATSSLSQLFGERLAAALGLTAGFSSLDGD